MKVLALFAILALVAGAVHADLYMHNPRGSNNRCDEQSNNRNNANRLFNSQNNAAGGYALQTAPMYYYEGSILTVEWTQQHGCGDNGRLDCQILLQYACEDTLPGLRDGQSDYPLGIIVDGDCDPLDNNCQSGQNTCTDRITEGTKDNERYGSHEPLEFDKACRNRERNQGLFTADQGVNNNQGAQATRQNPGGTQYGFECQEERDYYPYWHPTPWRDAVVMTTNDTRCELYTTESQNVKSKHFCDTTAEAGAYSYFGDAEENNEKACEQAGNVWKEFPAWEGMEAPECTKAVWGRSNHLGSDFNGYMPSYNWTIPTLTPYGEDAQKKYNENEGLLCVARLRYNMTSSEYDAWAIDSGENDDRSPVTDDPYVAFGSEDTDYLRLAVDTSQFARTFQDRSYTFWIKKRPAELNGKTIFNLNVRGKRGNIAQVRNCVEYDFVPERLHVKQGEFVHFQWTGSNHNPANNAGEGRNRWDRSNIVQVGDLANNYPMELKDQTMFDKQGDEEVSTLAWRMAFLDQAEQLEAETGGSCRTLTELEDENNDQHRYNCAKLNGSPTAYFDAGAVKMNKTGEYHYISSRNNNWTNRDQKGTLVVEDAGLSTVALVFIGLGAATVAGAGGYGGYRMYQNRAGGMGGGSVQV